MTTAELEARGWIQTGMPLAWWRGGIGTISYEDGSGQLPRGWWLTTSMDDELPFGDERGPFATLADAVRAAEGGET